MSTHQATSQKEAWHPRSSGRSGAAFRIADWLTAAILAVLLAAVLLFVVFTPVSVKSSSVSDFFSGDLVFADRLFKHVVGFARGDAVVYKAKEGASVVRHISRVAAFGGEKVIITGGRLYVDGALVDDSAYAEPRSEAITAEFTVPTGSLFLLPDEREALSGSDIARLTVAETDVVGEVRFIAFPITRLRFFS